MSEGFRARKVAQEEDSHNDEELQQQQQQQQQQQSQGDKSKSRRINALLSFQRLVIHLKNVYANASRLTCTKEVSVSVSFRAVLILLFTSALVLYIVPTITITAISPLTSLTASLHASFSQVKVVTTTTNDSSGQSETLDVSIVILTNDKYDLLAQSLPTIIRQKQINFEVIIVDNKCHPETKKVVFDAFQRDYTTKSIPTQYVPLCNNQSDFVGVRRGVDVSSRLSNWIMFLHDDVVLEGDDFLINMVDIGETKPNAGGVACKLLNDNSKKSVGGGNIVWNDGSFNGVGHEEDFIYTPNLSYAKPVDYGPGACLMMKRTLFNEYKGFDNKNYLRFHREIDLQLHIQHDSGKEVWFQPNAIAYQGEQHEIDKDAITNSFQFFVEKWGDQLQASHLEKPFAYDDKHEWDLQFMRASDLRARDKSKANILWLEEAVRSFENGSGSERAFDNLSIAAGLGHRITLALQQTFTATECNRECRDQITNLGVEIMHGSWEDYVDKYIDFYDIVYIRRPAIFQRAYKKLQKAYKKHPFALIYDCETLLYKRDELLFSYLKDDKNSHELPGGVEYLGLDDGKMDMDLVSLEIRNKKEVEMKLIQMADTVITVSEKDRGTILESLPGTQVYTVENVMSTKESSVAKKAFDQRIGILFIGSFYDNMYFNGDAVWYFLTEVYPAVLEESRSPIPFTIAGYIIPKDLRDLVENDKILSENVIFQESPSDIDELLNSARIFVAPHLYGTPVHYKVSTLWYFSCAKGVSI